MIKNPNTFIRAPLYARTLTCIRKASRWLVAGGSVGFLQPAPSVGGGRGHTSASVGTPGCLRSSVPQCISVSVHGWLRSQGSPDSGSASQELRVSRRDDRGCLWTGHAGRSTGPHRPTVPSRICDVSSGSQLLVSVTRSAAHCAAGGSASPQTPPRLRCWPRLSRAVSRAQSVLQLR